MSAYTTPAFPSAWRNESGGNATSPDGQVVPPGHHVLMTGMTLRDYFAIRALPIAWDAYEKGYSTLDRTDVDSDSLADHAYALADAMLKRRRT